jgi:UDP-2,4-diacetamido-2,4,6-trideoxy-beta-L-altropyranose hydrolase
MPVGQVRVDVHDGIGTVSVAVAPGHRGRGLGSAILAGLVAEVAGDDAIGELRALVHPENIASLRAFEKVGFRDRKAREDGLVVLDRSGRRSDTGA